jgi:negative regulator of flagellin synthesis FlgM
MKITNKPGNYDNQAYVKEVTDNKRLESREAQSPEKKTETTRGDTVSLSAASRDLQIAKTAASASPEVRTEQVEAIKTAILEGRYQIDPEKIAEKMVGVHVSDLV